MESILGGPAANVARGWSGRSVIPTLGVVVTWAACVTPVTSAAQMQAKPDVAIEKCIAEKLSAAPAFRDNPITVKVTGAEAALTGRLTDPSHERRATQIARDCGATNVTIEPVHGAMNATYGVPGTNPVVATGGATNGLMPESGGEIVHDTNLHVYWLANANLAGDAAVRREMGVTGIEPNGMMDYQTALKWVAALNAYDGGAGWLGHNDWQLPATPMLDETCGAQGPQGASFGALCENSTLGSLYYAGLKRKFPENVVSGTGASVGLTDNVQFKNVQLSYYWTGAAGGLAGRKVYSFGAGDGDATTTNDSCYYVLPMAKGEFGDHASCASGGLVPYTSGPAANVAVYDCRTRVTWPLDANLAATNPLGISAAVRIVEKRPYPDRRGNPVTIKAPPIVGGAMLFTTANQWVAALNARDGAGWLGHNTWQLPDINDLRDLDSLLDFSSTDIARLQVAGSVGPFRNLQPFFYWEKCAPEPIDKQSRWPRGAVDCVHGNAPPGRQGGQMQYDFTFGYGIQGTDVGTLKYFTMVYYPDPKAPHLPPKVNPGRMPQVRRGRGGTPWRFAHRGLAHAR